MGAFLAAGFCGGLGGTVLSAFYSALLGTVPTIHAYEWAVNMLPLLCWPTLMFLGACGGTAMGFLIIALACYGWVLFGWCWILGPAAAILGLCVGCKLNLGVETESFRGSIHD